MADARAAEIQGRDAADAAKAAVEQIKEQITELTAECADAEKSDQIHARISELLAPVAVEKLARAKQLRVDFLTVASELRGILSGDANVPGPLGSIRDAAIRFLNYRAGSESVWTEANRRQGAWRDVKKALSNDPDAPWPTDEMTPPSRLSRS